MKTNVLNEEVVLRLRRDFDASFRSAPKPPDETLASYLVAHVAGARYAIALRQVSALLGQPRITRLPSLQPSLLGVCGSRSELLAVYDLGQCLGQTPASSHRWLVRVAGTTLAFAFEHLERHARGRESSHASATPVLTLDEFGSVPLLDLQQLARKVAANESSAPATPTKER